MQDWWNEGPNSKELEDQKKTRDYVFKKTKALFKEMVDEHDRMIQDGIRGDWAGSSSMSVMINVMALMMPLFIATTKGEKLTKETAPKMQKAFLDAMNKFYVEFLRSQGMEGEMRIVTHEVDFNQGIIHECTDETHEHEEEEGPEFDLGLPF